MFIRLDEVLKLTSLSRSSIYRLMSLGDFPKKYQLSERAVGWKLDEVNDWLNTRGH